MTAPGQAWEQFADLPGIDMAKAMDTWGDFVDLQHFLHHFVLDYASCANQFSALLADGEAGAASDLMHKLKGAAGSLSLPDVFQAARAIEDCKDAQAALPLVPRLRLALETVFGSIGQLGGKPAPAVQHRADPAQATAVLTALLQELGNASGARASLLLAELMPLLHPVALGAIQDCLDCGNLRAAATLVRELAREQNILLPS
jgi:HPt (histidine-containing phosphotransfer) domain-containing protein